MFVPSLVEILEEDFKILSMYFRYFVIIFSLKTAACPYIFKQTRIPFIQASFVPSLVEIDPVILEKNKTVKSLQRPRRWTTEKFRSTHVS